MVDDIYHIKQINPSNKICEACLNRTVKITFLQKLKNKSHVKRPLFIIHSDVCGPVTPNTIDNKNYFVTFINDFTHYTVTYLITYKSEVLKVFKDFVTLMRIAIRRMGCLAFCDNGRENLLNEFKDYCVHKGINYHLTIPHTQQQKRNC